MEEKMEEKTISCLSFSCDENLEQFTDSMLFESGTNIATGVFEYNGKTVTVNLDVCGEVDVTYKDERYRNPSEFPDELKTIIRQNPNNWDTLDASDGEQYDCYLYVGSNNWFEFTFDGDGMVEEKNLSKMTPEQVCEDMQAVAEWFFN